MINPSHTLDRETNSTFLSQPRGLITSKYHQGWGRDKCNRAQNGWNELESKTKSSLVVVEIIDEMKDKREIQKIIKQLFVFAQADDRK